MMFKSILTAGCIVASVPAIADSGFAPPHLFNIVPLGQFVQAHPHHCHIFGNTIALHFTENTGDQYLWTNDTGSVAILGTMCAVGGDIAVRTVDGKRWEYEVGHGRSVE